MNITHKGASIFYTDQGSGAPVIMLHGFLENHTMWDSFLEHLTSSYRVICIDLLGHGQSECTGYIHSMTEMAAAVYDVITKLNLTQIQIIGHSMGGYVGLAFAKAYPDKTTSLCLLNSTPEPDSLERKDLRTRANEMAKKQFEPLIRLSFVNLFDPIAKKDFSQEIKQSLEQALQTPIQGYIAANSGMQAREDHSTFWKNAPIHKGMILGESDWIINAETHKELYKNNIDFFKCIKSGHMSHISNYKETLHYLLEFLSLSDTF